MCGEMCERGGGEGGGGLRSHYRETYEMGGGGVERKQEIGRQRPDSNGSRGRRGANDSEGGATGAQEGGTRRVGPGRDGPTAACTEGEEGASAGSDWMERGKEGAERAGREGKEREGEEREREKRERGEREKKERGL